MVANETLGGRRLVEIVRERAAEGNTRFVLAVPQNRPKAGLVIYDDMVFDAAQARVDLALAFLHSQGIEAIGEVGDPDPYSAAMDAVYEHRPSEIIISTYPATRSGWLRKDLIDRVREATRLPVDHVVSDPDTEGLPFDVTLAVANRTATGKELFEALKAKVEAEPEDKRATVHRCRPAGGWPWRGRPPRTHAAQACPRPAAQRRAVRGRVGRRPGPLHRDHERAPVLPRRRHRDLDLP